MFKREGFMSFTKLRNVFTCELRTGDVKNG